MAKQTINLGAIPGDKTGTLLRDGGDMINDNFTELYGHISADGLTVKARFHNNGGTAISTEANVTAALGLTPAAAGAEYTAFIRYENPGQYFMVMVYSDGLHWYIWANGNIVLKP